MGKRQRRRTRSSGESPAAATTTTYPFGEGGSISLRDELGDGTMRTLQTLDAQPAASADDRWQRRIELLFERLVVSWEIAGLPLKDQRELLGRYRMASADERKQVRDVLAGHLRERHPEIEL